MNYQEALEYLESLGQFGIRPGMERITQLLLVLGHPENQIKCIHVAGTNGKGSVTSMITDILLTAGLHVGKFTSPHLVRYNERFQLDGKEISDEDFAVVLTKVREAAEQIVRNGAADQPTQFEVLTAAAFFWFAQEKVDYAVIEVGLGGLLDSTNVIKEPVVTVITNIAMDHTKVLGDTPERIALQKAGIIKEKAPVVTGASGAALGPIQVVSAFKQAPIYVYGVSFHGEPLEGSMDGQKFTLCAGTNYRSDYEIRLPGAHQVMNASLAVVAAKIVSKGDPRITEEHLHQGVSRTVWPGRLEKIGNRPDVILDGAHNPDGTEALRKALDTYYEGKPVDFVFGMMGDKDMESVIKALIRPCDWVLTVKADEGERAATAEDLAELVRKHGGNAEAESDLAEAFSKARERAGEDGVVCVCGSLYLVGRFKKEVELR